MKFRSYLKFAPLAALPLIALAGCGGGGTTLANNTPGGGGEVTTGNFNFAGQLNQPMVTSGPGATVYALTGSISKAVMADTSPTVEETEIVASRRSNLGVQIIATSPDGSNPRVLCNEMYDANQIYASATWVYYLNSHLDLKRVPLAGGTPVTLKTGVNSFALSPDGAKLAYMASYDYNLCNADGSNDILMVHDNSKLYHFFGWVSPTAVMANVAKDLYTINATAGSTFSGCGAIANAQVCAVDSAHHVLTANSPTGVQSYLLNEQFIPTATGSLNPLTKTVRQIAYSPDGKSTAFAYLDTNDQLAVGSVGGATDTVIGSDYAIFGVAWTPYIPSRQFVPAGVFSGGASAILYSENGSRVPNIVMAAATTPSSMVATKISVDGSTNVVYKLTCDQITKLYYTKGLNYAQTGIVTSASGIKGAFVSFDASNGNVSSVLTFTGTPNARPMGHGVEISGEGLEMHDLTGKKPMSSGKTFIIP